MVHVLPVLVTGKLSVLLVLIQMQLFCAHLCSCGELWHRTRADGFGNVRFTHTHTHHHPLSAHPGNDVVNASQSVSHVTRAKPRPTKSASMERPAWGW